MKATVTFEVNDYDDELELIRMFRLQDYISTIENFSEYLRRNRKYQETPDSFDAISDKWYEVITDLPD